MIHVEDHVAEIEGDVMEIADNVLGIMDVLNTHVAPNSTQGDFFWSSLFSAKTIRD